MDSNYSSMEKIMKDNNIRRRDLVKFKEILKVYQPNNGYLLTLLDQYTYRYIDSRTKMTFDKTIDALFESLAYPVNRLETDNYKMTKNYKLVKDCIIEYCLTDIQDISTIIDNVAFHNNMTIEETKNRMSAYMSNYGDIKRIMIAFSRYSDNYEKHVNSANLPETYIPIYSKAVVEKIREMKNETKNSIKIV